MYHSVVKVKKNHGLEFFKIKLQSSICFYKVVTLILFTKSSDILNKNTLGVKKVQGQSEPTLQTGMCDQKL